MTPTNSKSHPSEPAAVRKDYFQCNDKECQCHKIQKEQPKETMQPNSKTIQQNQRPVEGWEKEFDAMFLGKNKMLFTMGLLNEYDIKIFIHTLLQKEREKLVRECVDILVDKFNGFESWMNDDMLRARKEIIQRLHGLLGEKE